jgi:predicted molibdopterin-dependent oxidoreductase YjgC
MTNDFESIKSADTILIIGSNTTENHPVIGSFIKEQKRKGKCTLIVCDPRKIEMAKYADVYIRQKSGSDVALLNGLMHVIIRENLHAAEFVEKNVNNFDKLRETVARYTPEYVSGITGVAPELIEDAARAYARGPNSAIFYTMGITQHVTGTNNVRTVANLALLCGMLGRPGTGVNPLRGQNNVQGACDMGCLPDVIPGYQKVALPAARQKAKDVWGADIPETPGLSVVEMMEAAGEGKIRGLYIMGENSMVTEPDSGHVRHALKNLEFLVVQDIFLTETAELAHVVLPASSWGEKDGTFTNTCRAVQRVRKAVDSPGEARPDWEILLAVGKRMGAPWDDMTSPETIFNAIAKITPSYAGITYGRLEGGSLNWPCPACDHPAPPFSTLPASREARRTFHPANGRLPTSGRTRNILSSPPQAGSVSLPLGSMTRRSSTGDFIKEMAIEVNPADARSLGCNDGEMIRVSSRRGSVAGAVKVTDRVPAGMVFLPFHFSETPANSLTSSQVDPVSKTPGFKVSAVRVEKS